jgi:hypothetical protein
MTTKLTPKFIAARSGEFLTSWRQYAPDLVLAGRTLAEFEAEREIPTQVKQRLDSLKAKYTGCILERNQAVAALKNATLMLANAVRSDPNHGPDSAFYRSLGFKTTSERKRPGPKPKRAAKADSPATSPPLEQGVV